MAHFSGNYMDVIQSMLGERADELGIPPEVFLTSSPRAESPATPSLDETLDRIDAATGCQQCGNPLGSSPSFDFCSEFCQATWHEKRVGILRAPSLSHTSGIIVTPSVHGFEERMNTAARTARSLAGLIYGNPAILEALGGQQTPPAAEGM